MEDVACLSSTWSLKRASIRIGVDFVLAEKISQHFHLLYKKFCFIDLINTPFVSIHKMQNMWFSVEEHCLFSENLKFEIVKSFYNFNVTSTWFKNIPSFSERFETLSKSSCFRHKLYIGNNRYFIDSLRRNSTLESQVAQAPAVRWSSWQ